MDLLVARQEVHKAWEMTTTALDNREAVAREVMTATAPLEETTTLVATQEVVSAKMTLKEALVRQEGPKAIPTDRQVELVAA